jgi:hypothetical protein
MLRFSIAAALSLACVVMTHAIDKGQYNSIDPATRDWFRSLRSPTGIPCCDYADGNRIEAPDYKQNEDGSYEVFARGKWVHVPENRIVKAINRMGYAVLWWADGVETPYCFMPGAGG